MFFWPEMQGSVARARTRGERGSILIAAVLFLFFVFLVAGLAVDVSRYYLYSENTQNIADGAALAGARALSQYSMDDIDESKVNQSVIQYIRNNQGAEHAKLYAKNSSREVKVSDQITEYSDLGNNPTADIQIVRFDPDDQQLCQTFSTNPDGLSPNNDSPSTTRPLGAALRWGGDGDRVPVTAQIEIKDHDGPNRTYEPWGSYDDPLAGDLNTGSDQPEMELMVEEEDTMVIRARSWDTTDRGGPDVLYEGAMDKPDGYEPETRVLRDGDHPFESEGFKDQADAQDFIQDFIDDDGEIDIGRHQALVFFELGSDDPSSDAYDMQDLVLLVSFPPPSGSGGARGGSLPPYITSSGNPCGNEMPVYRVGVQTVENFSPLFLPESVFGQQNRAIQRHAVAEVRPRILRSYGNRSMNCGVYAGRIDISSTRGMNASSAALCSGGSVNANGATGAALSTVSLPRGNSFARPSGSVSRTDRFDDGSRPIPALQTRLRNPTHPDYNVDVNDFASSDWPDGDAEGCDREERVDGWGNPLADGERAVQTTDDRDVVWHGDSTPVCVTNFDATNQTLDLNGNGRMVIDGDENQPIGVYSNRPLRVTGSLTLEGGLYSTRAVTVGGLGGHRFRGRRDTLGGVALWSGQNLQVNDENNGFRGIVGADGNVTIGQSGQPGSDVMGLLLAGGTLTLRGDNITLNHDSSRYQNSVLNASGWSQRKMNNLGNRVPPMAEATVRLID